MPRPGYTKYVRRHNVGVRFRFDRIGTFKHMRGRGNFRHGGSRARRHARRREDPWDDLIEQYLLDETEDERDS